MALDTSAWGEAYRSLPAVEMSYEEYEALLGRSEQMLANGLLQQATLAFAALGVVAPNDPRPFLGMGQAMHHSRSYGTAFVAYGIASSLDPEDMVALALHAECGVLTLQTAEAAQLVDDVLRRARPDARTAPYLERLKKISQRQAQPAAQGKSKARGA